MRRSGRLLVGLRWWSYVREDGSNDWIFESLEDTSGMCFKSKYNILDFSFQYYTNNDLDFEFAAESFAQNRNLAC